MNLKFSYILCILLACLIVNPAFAQTPVKVKKSKSGNPKKEYCIAPMGNLVFYHLVNTMGDAISIDYIEIDIHDNSISEIEYWVNNQIINGNSIFPLTVPKGGVLEIICYTDENFFDTHISFGNPLVESTFAWGFHHNEEFYSEEVPISIDICGNLAIEKGDDVGDEGDDNNEDDDETPDNCELMYSDILTFTVSNRITCEVTIAGLTASFENNPYNEIESIIILDANNEEELSIPHSVAPLDEEDDHVHVQLLLSKPLGYPNYGNADEEQSYNIVFDTENTMGEFSFENSDTTYYDFGHCGEEGLITDDEVQYDLQVFPNPVSENTVAVFEVPTKTALVSAYLIPMDLGGKGLIQVIDNEVYPRGEHLVHIPYSKLKGGLYQLIIEMNGEKKSISILQAKK